MYTYTDCQNNMATHDSKGPHSIRNSVIGVLAFIIVFGFVSTAAKGLFNTPQPASDPGTTTDDNYAFLNL